MSDHFDGRRFFNPSGANGQPTWKVPLMLAERRSGWPRWIEVAPRTPPLLDGAAAVASFIGHATLLIQTPAGNLITDPIFSLRASPMWFPGPQRTRPAAMRLEELPAIAVVLLSHNHYDHCDLPSLRAIEEQWRPLFVTPVGNARLLRAAGVRRVEELDWWQSSAQAPMPIIVTPAQHFSARTPFDRNRALWGGFMIGIGGGRQILFAADTGYGPHFVDIRSRLGTPELAFLPIGAYEPRWFMKDIHMNPAEAVQAHLDLGSPPLSVGIHFGTFQLTTEGIDDPARALAAALGAHGLSHEQFRVPEFGESFTLS
jgi:L-ascorbate metabolism protein UlaG (beta-lactamase superfamily)